MPQTHNTDNRQALPEGHILSIKEESTSNIHVVTVTGCIGRGGSCMVYKGLLTRSVEGKRAEASVIIKELYPAGLGINRVGQDSGDMSLYIPENAHDVYDHFRENFGKAQTELSAYYESFKSQTLPRLFLYGSANATAYAVSDPGCGRLLSDIPRDTLTFGKTAAIMESLCRALKKLHTKEKLYLDCKPDNLYCSAEKDALGADVFLFDFDSVMKLSDIKSGKYRSCPFSPGWAAPEQIPSGIDGRYEDPSLIGYHTDIFAVGEVFFWLLTGRKHEREDLDAISKDLFDWEKESCLCAGVSVEVKALVNELEKEMLEQDPAGRKERYRQYIAINSVEKSFRRLFGLTAGGDEHFAPIHESIEGLKKDIDERLDKKNQAREFFFGTKKRIAVTICSLAAAAAVAGIAGFLGASAAGKVLPGQSHLQEQILDDHVILELQEADHDYATGIENWKRLDYNRALRDLDAAYERVSGTVSPDGADTARINNSLGCLYLDMGRYKDAYDRLNDALAAFKKLYGENAAETLAVRFSVAQHDYLAGDTDTAMKSLQKIIDTGDVWGNKPLAAAILNFQAGIYDELGEYEKAVSAYEEVLTIYDDIMSDGKLTGEFSRLISDPQLNESKKDEYASALGTVLTTCGNMAESYSNAGEYDRSEELLTEALDTALENVYIGRKNLISSKLYMNLAKNYERQGKVTGGIEAIDMAERIQNNIFDYEATYPGLVEVYEIYGDLLMKDHDFSKAYTYYNNAIELAEKSFGRNHPGTAEALYRMGMAYLEKEYPLIALDYLEEAVEIRKNILGYENVKTLRYLEALSEAYTGAGNIKEAQEAISEAEDLREKLLARV